MTDLYGGDTFSSILNENKNKEILEQEEKKNQN